MPGDFGLGALLSAGPMLASHYVPVDQVSYLLRRMSMLMALGYSVYPLGLVLLSKVTMMLAENRLEEVRARLAILMAAILEISVFACVLMVVFADVLVRLWVGPRFLPAAGLVRIVLLSVPFHMFYSGLCSVVEAGSQTPHNTRNVFLALTVFIVLACALVWGVQPNILLKTIATSILTAIAVLAWFTSRSIHKIYNLRLNWGHSLAPVLVAVLLGGPSFLIHWSSSFRTSVIELVAIELAVGALFFGFLLKAGSSWAAFLFETAFGRSIKEMSRA